MDAEWYQLVKTVHLSTAIVTICFFTYRSLRKLADGQYNPPRWLKIFPHINDTLLLSCAVYLAVQSQQLPITTNWLSAKVAALLVYIGMGLIVMRYAKTRTQRAIAFGLAILSFGYIVLVALSRSATMGL